MRFSLAVLALAALFASCGSNLGNLLPDGGRNRVHCTNAATTVGVKVLDPQGNPAVGATVLALNKQTSQQQTGTTNGDGIFRVTDDIAPGLITVTATLSTTTSQEGALTFTCGECDCAVNPNSLTLNLK